MNHHLWANWRIKKANGHNKIWQSFYNISFVPLPKLFQLNILNLIYLTWNTVFLRLCQFPVACDYRGLCKVSHKMVPSHLIFFCCNLMPVSFFSYNFALKNTNRFFSSISSNCCCLASAMLQWKKRTPGAHSKSNYLKKKILQWCSYQNTVHTQCRFCALINEFCSFAHCSWMNPQARKWITAGDSYSLDVTGRTVSLFSKFSSTKPGHVHPLVIHFNGHGLYKLMHLFW